ncbi:MAG TPA: PQQ-binding-like beta-propeller repeat protein [Polyangiaceae bacterium]|nr:PQQ-binding-like beta-propeller repeat protein [Polyangiaceae bacterium]
MRRLPVVAVAVLVAMVLTAAGIHRKGLRTDRAPEPTSMQHRLPPPRADGGLGAGPVPDLPVRPSGTRALHGDARHTHRAAGRAPRNAPSIAWSRDVGGPVEAQVVASADEKTLYVASLGGLLVALAASDGTELWRLELGDRAYATPCVGDDGTVYAGADSKKLFAVSPEGKVQWSLDTDGDTDTGIHVDVDGTIVFAAGRTVYRATRTGQVKWRFDARRKVFTSPAIGGGGRIFFGSQDHHVYALTSDGRLAWQSDLGADVDGAAVVGDDGAVYVGTDGDEVVRLDAEDGRVRWRVDVGGFVRGTLSMARNGDVLAGVYGPKPRAVRLRGDDGRIVGDFSIQGTGAKAFGVHGGALEDETGTLLFGGQDDHVYAVGADGELLWRVTADDDVDAPLTLLGDGSVIVASDDGRVRKLVELKEEGVDDGSAADASND